MPIAGWFTQSRCNNQRGGALTPEEKAPIVYNRLMANFGMPEWHVLPPIDELVNTIISQNTNDRNRDIAFARLRERFPGWQEVMDAAPEEVIDCIRYAGLANQKGPRIQAVLRRISEESADFDLSFLKNQDAGEVRDWLTSFNGVGRKTASIVMLFSLGIPAFPVDTHIYRVSGRLGLRPQKMSADQAHDYLATLFPPQHYGPAHINLIQLGRRICDARKPACESCFLRDLCDFAVNQQQSDKTLNVS